MTPSEFKAWFQGYSENIGATPTANQWKRVREEIEKITPSTPVASPPQRHYPLSGGIMDAAHGIPNIQATSMGLSESGGRANQADNKTRAMK